MGAIRKFLGIVFSLAGLICLAAFALTWYGPWVREVSSLMSYEWFYWGVAGLAGITALGLVVTLIRSLMGRKVDTIQVSRLDGGKVTITRDAVASLTTKIIEADGTCIAEDVKVTAKPKGDIRVRARVQPISTVPVLDKGAALTQELRNGLAGLCGNALKSVDLTFTEPQTERYETPVQHAAQEAVRGAVASAQNPVRSIVQGFAPTPLVQENPQEQPEAPSEEL